MQHGIPRPARVGLTIVKVTAVAWGLVAGLFTPPAPRGPFNAYHRIGAAADASTPVARVLAKHDCSTTGFEEETPASAVIRTGAGRLRHVSFDEGWAVYTRHGAAQLVAVCLDPAPEHPRDAPDQ